uniref:KIF-binding protein isoform X2 n=1 Tax=Myxine glutinosa TaxID=7769 RepID=UPI00358DEF89
MAEHCECPASWRDAYRRARLLLEDEAQRDPPDEPFRSKYAARNVLDKLLAELEQADEPGGLLLVLRRAAVRSLQATVCQDVEEAAASLELLEDITERLDIDSSRPESVSLAMGVQTQLGMIWVNRDDMEKALPYLEAAEEMYKRYKKEVETPPLDVHELFMAQDEMYSEKERKRRFEKAHTHTLCYLALVCKKLEQPERAAAYCLATLQRQLMSQDYDPVDWATNATMLSQYYILGQQYAVGRHCLAAASVVIAKVPEFEEADTELADIPRCKAEIRRCWIKYCVNLLEDSRLQLEDSIGELHSKRQQELQAQQGEANQLSEAPSLFSGAVIMDAVSLEEGQVPCELALSYPEARAMFLFGQSCVQAAKRYYSLNSHTTDYVEVVQDYGELFNALSFFEPDMHRRCKMQKRRIDLLAEVYQELNPRFYLRLCRELQMELAEACYNLMDLKVSISSNVEQPSQHAAKKINQLAQEAIRYYQLFLNSLCDLEGRFPETLPPEVERAALVANFRMGGLHRKLLTTDGAQKLANTRRAYDCYRFVEGYCVRHPEAGEKIPAELELSQEIVGLLPAEIQRLTSSLGPCQQE